MYSLFSYPLFSHILSLLVTSLLLDQARPQGTSEYKSGSRRWDSSFLHVGKKLLVLLTRKNNFWFSESATKIRNLSFCKNAFTVLY